MFVLYVRWRSENVSSTLDHSLGVKETNVCRPLTRLLLVMVCGGHQG